MPITVAPDPANPGKFIWVDATTGAPAVQPGGPGTAFVAPSDLIDQQPQTATGGVTPTRPAGTVPYSQIASSLNKSGWTPVPGSLQKEEPKMVDNPRAGLSKPDGTKEPAQIAQDTGRWQVVFSTGQDQPNRLVYLTPASGQNPGAAGKDPTSDEFSWTIASAPADVPERATGQELNDRVAKAAADRATAEANSQVAQASLKKIQDDAAERERNAAAGKGLITDDELRKLQKDAADQNLTQQQIDARKLEIENSNRNSQASNQIAALNAATSAQNAATQARADEARIKLGEGQLGLDQAKLEYQKSQDEITNRNAAARIQLEQLTQQQANQISQQSNVLRGQELTQRTASDAAQLEQRKAEAAQTAETARQTAAIQAASTGAKTILEANAQGAQTGAGLLNQRVSSATSALNQFMGGLASGKMLNAPPAGFGANLVGGLQEWITGLGGGQPVYDTAAAMVNAAHPNISQNPEQVQQAYATLRGMMDLYKQQTGQDYSSPATQALLSQNPNAARNTGMTAPSTYNPQDIQWNQPSNAANVPGRVMGPGGVITTPGQTVAPVQTQAPVAVPAGMYNPAYTQQYPSAVGQPATGPVVGPIQPLPIPVANPYSFRAPVTV